MKPAQLLAVLAAAAALAAACAPVPPPAADAAPADFHASVTGPAAPWNHLRFADEAQWHFAVLADRTGGERPGVFEGAVARLNLLRPRFAVCVGDLIEGNTADEEVLRRQRDRLDEIVAGLEVPFFRLAGNHDIGNAVMAKTYRQRYGEPYYHFVYRDALFLCLCTEDPPATQVSPEQIDHVRRALEANKDVRWTFVLMHKPLYEPQAPGAGPHPAWTQIEALLGDRPYTVFAGHKHVYEKWVKDGRKHVRLSVTGGTTGPRGLKHKAFDHFLWVTMTPDGPRIAVVLLEGVQDDDLALP